MPLVENDAGSDGDVESGAAPFALELADPSADMFASNGTLAPRRRVSAHEHRVRPREWPLGRVSQTYPPGALQQARCKFKPPV